MTIHVHPDDRHHTERPTYLDCHPRHVEAVATVSARLIKDSMCPLALRAAVESDERVATGGLPTCVSHVTRLSPESHRRCPTPGIAERNIACVHSDCGRLSAISHARYGPFVFREER